MAIQNNPSVNTPPPSSTPAADAATRPGASGPAETARPPAEAPRPGADAAGNPGGALGLPNAGTPDLTTLFDDNRQVQQGLIDQGAIDGQIGQAQDVNETARADTSHAHTEGERSAQDTQTRATERGFVNSDAQRTLSDARNTLGRLGVLQTGNLPQQGTTQRPGNPNQANPLQGMTAEQQQAFMQAMATRGDARMSARTAQAQGNPQAQVFRANGTLGYLMPSPTPGGRPVVVIQTRNPTGQANPSDPQNPHAEHAEGQPQTREAGDHAMSQFAGRQRPVGERRGADRTREEGEHAEGGGEGENPQVRQGDSALSRIVAQYHSGEGGQGGGEQQREASITETRERYTLQFGESEPDASTVNAAEAGVLGAVVLGGGTYIRRVAGRDHGGGQSDSAFGTPEERMLASAQGVHAGPAQDMGELRRLSVCVNGEMIDMGSTQGRARFDAICATNPEVRTAALDLVQQRQDFTRHVTAQLFNINGGEPSARA